ncbi:antibiotic biosynthesis monooxygenase [Croceibacterium sp. LX-88]|uniref:Antibiotic biosynthesis monooxygenase n=1 Tax=Croceibacterium selenioxidans TaxID=2838833 RepID=A0ABS5W0R2_9SPHN|nr:putative quinol monooxygenase [Croceibacterium selenioxidans]MBT2133234.1 antibiotic biosynthesis monooxygenase [Croceibacterium selenioxidans]
MIAVIGTFRFPADSLAAARPLMRAVIEATLAEPGCRVYAYAEDIAEAGLFRVTEVWTRREALSAHFETAHMRQWSEQRASLGFFDRRITAYELGEAIEL